MKVTLILWIAEGIFQVAPSINGLVVRHRVMLLRSEELSHSIGYRGTLRPGRLQITPTAGLGLSISSLLKGKALLVLRSRSEPLLQYPLTNLEQRSLTGSIGTLALPGFEQANNRHPWDVLTLKATEAGSNTVSAKFVCNWIDPGTNTPYSISATDITASSQVQDHVTRLWVQRSNTVVALKPNDLTWSEVSHGSGIDANTANPTGGSSFHTNYQLTLKDQLGKDLDDVWFNEYFDEPTNDIHVNTVNDFWCHFMQSGSYPIDTIGVSYPLGTGIAWSTHHRYLAATKQVDGTGLLVAKARIYFSPGGQDNSPSANAYQERD